jgi:hypothetical protein
VDCPADSALIAWDHRKFGSQFGTEAFALIMEFVDVEVAGLALKPEAPAGAGVFACTACFPIASQRM